MRFLRVFTAALLCCLLIWVPALAQSSGGISGTAMVQTDGSCQVELTITIRLDSPQQGLTFPLEADATDVQLNGHDAPTTKREGKLQVALPDLTAGQHSFVLHYTLPLVIDSDKKGTYLDLPLLSGFGLDVEHLEFTLTMPGPIEARPVFQSGYYQENLRLHTDIHQNTLTASTMQPLKDHETLRLVLSVDGAQFHVQRQRLLSGWGWTILILSVLAAVYYFITMRFQIHRLRYSYTAPEGITAGDIGCCLTGVGTNLGMMVLSWAQLGYLQLELDRRGRVLLHKQMDMGNERNPHEVRIFQAMFARRTTVDATTRGYARLFRKVARYSPMRKQIYDEKSGNEQIFRALCCLIGMVGMLRMASNSHTVWMVLLSPVALILSFCIQSGCKAIPLRDKLPLLLSLGCGFLWILLGSLFDNVAMAVFMVCVQLAAGILAAFGGKRSLVGQRNQAQLLGLRHHMLTTEPHQMQQLQQKNPDYFYEMIPFALAFGVDRQFAKRFGSRCSLPACLWLKNAPHMNPQQCAAKLRQIANILEKARYAKV